MADFSERLRAAREAAGLSRSQLAARLGLGIAVIDKYENGRTTPSAEIQRKFLAACAARPDIVAQIIADMEQDIVQRLGKFASDLENAVVAARAVTPAAGSSAVDAAHPARRRKAH